MRTSSLLLLSSVAFTSVAQAKPKEFTSVRVDLEGREGLCPGESQKIDLFATDTKGKESKVRFGGWKQFNMSWDIGPVSPKGALEMPMDPQATWGKAGTFKVELAADSSARAEAALPVRYDCQMVSDYSGGSGAPGKTGAQGSSAAAAPGGDGGNGGDGQDGEDGPNLKVFVHLAKEPSSGEEILQVRVENAATGASTLHAVAVNGGKIVVRANGGSGGSGGAGGRGGNGATGLNGGDGGQGGNGGKGGRGGSIVVTVDPSAANKIGALQLENHGGGAGSAGLKGEGGQGFSPGSPGNEGHPGFAGQPGQDGPKPEIKTGAVAAMW